MIIPPALRTLVRNGSERPPDTYRPSLRAIEVAGDDRTGPESARDTDIDDFVVDWQLSLVAGPAR